MTKGRTYIVAIVDERENRHHEVVQFGTSPRNAIATLKRQDGYYRRLAERGARIEARLYPQAGLMLYTFCVTVLVLFAVLVMLLPVLVRAVEVAR